MEANRGLRDLLTARFRESRDVLSRYGGLA